MIDTSITIVSKCYFLCQAKKKRKQNSSKQTSSENDSARKLRWIIRLRNGGKELLMKV